MNLINQLKENKILKILYKVLNAIVIFLVIAFILVVFLQRFSDNKLSFFNYRMFTVISGSMEPRYKIGDVLISKEVDASKIKVGDTISYLGKSGSFKDKIITHEVVEIDKDENGDYIFHSKGLTNIVEDPIVYESQLYGVVKYRVVTLSLIYKIVGTKIGFYLFIILPLIFVIGNEFISVLLAKEEKRRSNLKS
jgi:signal peptidase